MFKRFPLNSQYLIDKYTKYLLSIVVSFWSVYSLKNGALILGTKNNGVIVFNTYYNTPDYQYDTINSTISTNNINNVLVDKIGNIWAGTNRGLCKINLGSDMLRKVSFTLLTITTLPQTFILICFLTTYFMMRM